MELLMILQLAKGAVELVEAIAHGLSGKEKKDMATSIIDTAAGALAQVFPSTDTKTIASHATGLIDSVVGIANDVGKFSHKKCK